MLAHIVASVLLASGDGKAKIAVLSLNAAGEVAPAVANAMTESITAEIEARGYFQAISSQEIATLIGVERQKQLLGCSEDSSGVALRGTEPRDVIAFADDVIGVPAAASASRRTCNQQSPSGSTGCTASSRCPGSLSAHG